MKPSGTILLIEEDQELRKLFRGLLEHMGHWVIATPEAERAPFAFDTAATADLLVADVTVPDSASIALTAELLARRADLGALLISTDDAELEVRRRFKDSRTRFLRKPFSIEELREAVARARLVSPPAVAAASSRRRAYVAWGLAAAAAFVLVAGALVSGTGLAPPIPEAAASTVVRGTALEVVEPTGDLAVMPARLSWDEVPDAARYRIRILAVDETVLWQGESRVATLALPPEARDALYPGVVYSWTVEALDAQGAVRASSAATRFQVVPSGPEKGERE